MFAALGVLFFLASPVAGDGGDELVKIRWEFAGSFYQNFARVGPAPAPVTTNVGRANIIHVEAIGKPGRATVRVGGGGGAALDPPADFPPPELPVNPCEGLSTSPFPGENSFIATLHDDVSLLWGARDASLASFACSDPATGLSHGVIYIVFRAGTGRFAGATGRGIITFHAESVVPGSSLNVDTGTITGSIRVNDDDDDD
jgi:hypothetical protein